MATKVNDSSVYSAVYLHQLGIVRLGPSSLLYKDPKKAPEPQRDVPACLLFTNSPSQPSLCPVLAGDGRGVQTFVVVVCLRWWKTVKGFRTSPWSICLGPDAATWRRSDAPPEAVTMLTQDTRVDRMFQSVPGLGGGMFVFLAEMLVAAQKLLLSDWATGRPGVD